MELGGNDVYRFDASKRICMLVNTIDCEFINISKYSQYYLIIDTINASLCVVKSDFPFIL